MTPFALGILIGAVGGIVIGFCVCYVVVRVEFRRQRKGYIA